MATLYWGGGAVWYAANNSVDVSGNTGWIFMTGSAIIDIGRGITIGQGIQFT